MRLTARKLAAVFVASAAVLLMFGEAAYAQTAKPNILVIFGDGERLLWASVSPITALRSEHSHPGARAGPCR